MEVEEGAGFWGRGAWEQRRKAGTLLMAGGYLGRMAEKAVSLLLLLVLLSFFFLSFILGPKIPSRPGTSN